MADTVKDLRKALKRVTNLLDATDDNVRAYVRVDPECIDPDRDEFLLTGKITVDLNGYVVIHAE